MNPSPTLTPNPNPAPNQGPIDDYMAKIATFPLIDRPEIFGLHQNADISCQVRVRLRVRVRVRVRAP